ncbi:Ni/Fe-hydrogenase 2 integral membrane subunit HybB [Desulfonatronum thiosulfatophilum]|uniref:Ni/Fe-hydrogenase 2 integral membrane subunit HybB n=1 Tax=Desulfonatronum thiosulfatophilum TaxID=617002 RepID=A0A1G6CX77_9BACT|nr:Ni/Fe-hydrogenase cytochrome b subunit [Desulfonatronum thiosulfatophilum]SDB37438.1 Ni/Fe-hydrogenase 2 integral membrane subunit HybB [Desulfonatronum thiosulfatophilum]
MSNVTQNDSKSYFTPFNIVTGLIIIAGLIVTVLRFTGGLGAVTNLDDNYPWGIWISFDLLCGVALAAGGYTTAAACYIFGLKKFHSAVRPALLTALLGYILVVLALHYDVGRPWRLPYPLFVQQGVTSLLFEVGLCVFLYLTVLFLEFLPAVFEWTGWKKLREPLIKLTFVLTIFGVVLSTLHQSSLGALYLIAPMKIHPLWYSAYLPIFFFVSSIAAGLSMVMFEGALSHRYLHRMMDDEYNKNHDYVVLSFAKACSWVLFGYFALKMIGVAYDNNWHYFSTGYGVWFLVELLCFVALPAFLYAVAAREKNFALIKWTAVITVLGIVLNRFNVSLVAYNFHLPAESRYFPSIMEIIISIFIVTIGLVVFRFVSLKMPVFFEHPKYKALH